MSNSLTTTNQYRPEAIETAVQWVMALGRKLLVENPEQLLGIVERQSGQLLSQQSELSEY